MLIESHARRLAQERMNLSDLEWAFHASRAISAIAKLLVPFWQFCIISMRIKTMHIARGYIGRFVPDFKPIIAAYLHTRVKAYRPDGEVQLIVLVLITVVLDTALLSSSSSSSSSSFICS